MPPDALGRGAPPATAEGFVEGDQVGSRRTAALHQSVFGSVESTLRLKETEEVRLACGIEERRQLCSNPQGLVALNFLLCCRCCQAPFAHFFLSSLLLLRAVSQREYLAFPDIHSAHLSRYRI